MIGRITSYLQNWWSSDTGYQLKGICAIVIVAAFLISLSLINPNKSPIRTLSERISALESTRAELAVERDQLLTELGSAKQQIHTLNQALITITSDVSALNNVINRNDLTIVYKQNVEDVRKQIDKNMKTISESMSELTSDK